MSVSGLPLAVVFHHVVVTFPTRRQQRSAGEAMDVADAVSGREQHQLDVAQGDRRNAESPDRQGGHEGSLFRLHHEHERRLRPQRHSLPRRVSNGRT